MNTKTIETVRQYQNIMSLYKITNGQYPNVGAEYVCLPANLPVQGPFGSNVCEINGGAPVATTYSAASDVYIADLLKTVQASLPDAGYNQIMATYRAGSYSVRGIVYSDDGGASIQYHLNGVVNCPVGTKDYGVGSTNTVCVAFLD